MAAPAQLDLVFGALANNTRRTLLKDLSRGHKTVLELAQPHSVSLNAISKHLKHLERAGLITRQVDGSYHHISIRPEAMKSAMKWMSRYAPFWEDNLASLKKFVEES